VIVGPRQQVDAEFSGTTSLPPCHPIKQQNLKAMAYLDDPVIVVTAILPLSRYKNSAGKIRDL
jgi:hypothetical protein